MNSLHELERTYNSLKARPQREPYPGLIDVPDSLWYDRSHYLNENLTEALYNKVLAFNKENVSNTFGLIELQAKRTLGQLPSYSNISNSRPSEQQQHQQQQISLPQSNLCNVVREVATMRTTVDIEAEDSRIVCKIPRHTQVVFDSSKVLFAGMEEDLVDVTRLHVLIRLQDVLRFRSTDAAACAHVGEYVSQVDLNNAGFVPNSGSADRWVWGWVSLHGRTVEDFAPIVEIIRQPKKDVISLL